MYSTTTVSSVLNIFTIQTYLLYHILFLNQQCSKLSYIHTYSVTRWRAEIWSAQLLQRHKAALKFPNVAHCHFLQLLYLNSAKYFHRHTWKTNCILSFYFSSGKGTINAFSQWSGMDAGYIQIFNKSQSHPIITSIFSYFSTPPSITAVLHFLTFLQHFIISFS